MEWETLLQQLIDLVASTAPKLWAIAIRQVYVYVVQNTIGLFITVPAMVYLAKAIKWSNKQAREEDDDYYYLSTLCWIAVVLVLTLTVGLLTRIAGELINPEYYAIELLLDYVK